MAGRPAGAGRSAWSTLSVVCLVSTLIGLNMSTLTIALPTLTRHFEASALESSWLLLSYMVTNTAALLLVGRLSDTLGQRRLYLWGLGLFTVASVLCGLAPTVEILIGLRVLAAVGGAVLLANGATLIHAAFRPPHLGTAMGFYAASFPAAHLLGPTVGGAVVETAGWEWVFWFNVPLCLLALIGGLLLLPPGTPAGDGPHDLDLAGNAAFMAVVVLATTGLSLASDLQWSHPLVWTSLTAAVLLAPVLVALERRATSPVLDLATVRRHNLGRLYGATFFNGAGRFPMVVLVSIYLQAVVRVGPAQAGLQILPLPVGSLLASLTVGRLSRRLTARRISALGSGIGLLGVMVVTVAIYSGSAWLLPVGLTIAGAGTGLFTGSNATSMLESSPPESLGVVNAMRLMLQSTGNVTSMALALTILTAALPERLREQLVAATLPAGEVGQVLPGFWMAFLFLCLLSGIGLALALPAQEARSGHVESAHDEVPHHVVTRSEGATASAPPRRAGVHLIGLVAGTTALLGLWQLMRMAARANGDPSPHRTRSERFR